MNWTALALIAAEGLLWLAAVVLCFWQWGRYTAAVQQQRVEDRQQAAAQADAVQRHTEALITASHYALVIHDSNREILTQILKVQTAQEQWLKDPLKNILKEA
jgi:hypothetical protein